MLRRQRRGDIGALRVLIGNGRKLGTDAWLIVGVDVGIADRAGRAVGGGVAGDAGPLGKRAARRGRQRRAGNMIGPGFGARRRGDRRLVRDVEELKRNRDDIVAGQLEERRLRDDRVGKVGRQLGVRVVEVGELQRKHVADDLLRVGRQLHGRLEADRALAIDDRLRAGPVDGCDRRQRGLVEQDVGAGGAVGLDQHLEFRRRRTALRRHLEIDLDQHRGSTDAHGRDRRVDLHVAFLGGGAGDEGDRALHQAEQRFVVRPVGVVDHFVQHHLGVRREAEHGAVDEGDAKRRIGAGLDDVAFVDGVALVQDDRHPVADRGRVAGQLGDVADQLRRDAGAAVRLRELGVPGQRVDDVTGEMGAIGRG